MTVAEITETEAPPETEPLPPAACAVCGILLDADGNADLERLHESVRGNDWTRAMRDDRNMALATRDRWRAAVKGEHGLGDTEALAAAKRQLVLAEGRVVDTEAVLVGRPNETPQDGPCDGCGTVFRAGQVDRAAIEHATRERTRLSERVGALENELRGAQAKVAIMQMNLADARAIGNKRATVEHEDALEVAVGYRGGVEAGLEDARAALNPPPDRKHHGRGK